MAGRPHRLCLQKRQTPGRTSLFGLAPAPFPGNSVTPLCPTGVRVTLWTYPQKLTRETDNVAEVLAAVNKAGIAFDLLMEIRNKLTDAYREIQQMRI